MSAWLLVMQASDTWQIVRVALPVVLGAYLLGSLPFGLWVVKALKGIDIREMGSGNIGTTNVLRAAGKGPAAVVLLLDALKGALPVLAVKAFFPSVHWLMVLAAFAAMLGHSKSIFLGFRGGKSVATGIGTVFALSPAAAGIELMIFGALFAGTRMVSVGSIAAAIALPFVFFMLGGPTPFVLYGVLASLVVLVRHRANIQRLVTGKENRL